VPESREEITTEGGLDVIGSRDQVQASIDRLRSAGIIVSLFLDPEPNQIALAAELGAEAVELHTGQYSLAKGDAVTKELARLNQAGKLIRELGMVLHAGHGLNYQNVRPIAQLEGMCELNIGHSIVARAVLIGMQQAVREMKQLIGPHR
jgi:pyridoxine 5-phosphate synthase